MIKHLLGSLIIAFSAIEYGRNDPIDITDPSGQNWLSSLLIDIGIGIGVAILPEIAPELFGGASSASGAVTFSSATALAGGNLSLTVSAYTWTDAIAIGGAYGVAAGATNIPQQTPTTPTPATPQAPKKNCPPVPNHPQAVDVNANIKLTQDEYNADPTGNGAKASWFNRSFNGGVWDHKVQYHSWQQWDDIGNFNYGATGSVFGYSMSTLSDGAVFARMFTENFWKHPSFRNAPHKDQMIRQGQQYYKNDCWH